MSEQVRHLPRQSAIAGTQEPLSFEELDRLADLYASAVLEHQPHAARRVALLLSHDGRQMAAALGALKCGMAIVTLNPSDPAARLAQIRAEIEPGVLITEGKYVELGRSAGFLESQMILGSATARGGRPAIRSLATPDDLAFLICTSGSTGRPKIVMQTHRNVLHNVLRYTNGLQVRTDDRIAWVASLSGGQGLVGAWTALLNGATLCPFPIVERGMTGLADWLEQNQVTVFDTIPSVLRSFARTLQDRRMRGVRLVRLASEAALRSDFMAYLRHFPGDCTLASVLASSEAGIIAQILMHADDEPEEGRLPVGAQAEGVEVLLVDPDGRPAAEGEVGEIVVQGRYLSPGYWGDPALTAERFNVVNGLRRFKTGDVARRSSGGRLTVLARADAQVKVRGHRLQLEEVEAAIAAHSSVAEVAVVVRTTARGDAKLTAYVTATPGLTPASGDLHRSLRLVLPPHAIPSAIVRIETLPLTPHGKIDRERLADLDEPVPPGPAGEWPASETEELVAGLWADAFERDAINPHQSFLEVGGDSLVAAMIAAGVDDVFGVDIDMQVFAADPTVAMLAALIDQQRQTTSDEDRPLVRQAVRSGPLSFTQARFWAEQARSGSNTHWNVAVPFRIRGPLDVEAFQQSVDYVVRRHEILHTTFSEIDGLPTAIVRPPASVDLPVHDLRTDTDPKARVDEIVAAELLRPYDLETGPMLRLRLLRLGDEDYELLRFSHHLVHDAASWKIFFDELAVVYEALIDGRRPPLAGVPALQYIDYAVWERGRLRPESPSHQAEVAWWQEALDRPPSPVVLPFTRAAPDNHAQPGGVIRWGLAREHTEGLARVGRAAGATYFMTRLAIFASQLAIETGSDDIVLGTPFSTRTRVELQRMFGPFINVRQLRLRFVGDPSFQEWLGEVRRLVIDVGARASIPWEPLILELRRRGVSVPRVSATFVDWSSVLPMRFGGIELEGLPRPCGEVPRFRLGVNRYYEADRCWAEFDPRVYDPAAIEGFLARLRALSQAVCAEPNRPLRALYGAISDGSH